MRQLLVGSVLLLGCTLRPATVPTPSTTGAEAAATTSAAPALAACVKESFQAAADFVERFNARDLAGLTSGFTADARALWVRRGEATASDGFRENGREMIGAMLRVRIADGEVLAYQRIDPDPDPRMQYADGSGQLLSSPRFVGSSGMFPDGAGRALSTKFVYACGQHGIVQLVIAPSG